jgi:hypothetical protein
MVPGSAESPPQVPWAWSCISLVALLSLAVIPAAFLARRLAVPWYLILFGAVTWGIAVALKKPLAVQLNKWLKNSSRTYVSASQGLLSAVLELGCAALYLWRMKGADIYSVLGFGVGAGAAEVVYVLVVGSLAKRDQEREAAWAAAARESLCVRYQVPIERFFATIGHVGSRGLVYVGLHVAIPGGLILLLGALVFFTVVDGVATYGHLCRWDWSNPVICRSVHGFFATVSLLEFTVFLIGFQFRFPGS